MGCRGFVIVLMAVGLGYVQAALGITPRIYTGIYSFKIAKPDPKDKKKKILERHNLLARLSVISLPLEHAYTAILTYHRGSFESAEYFSTFYRFMRTKDERRMLLEPQKSRREIDVEISDDRDVDQPEVHLDLKVENGKERYTGRVIDEAGFPSGMLILDKGTDLSDELKKYPIDPPIAGSYEGKCEHPKDEKGRPINIPHFGIKIKGVQIIPSRLGGIGYGIESLFYDASVICGSPYDGDVSCASFRATPEYTRGVLFTGRLPGGTWSCSMQRLEENADPALVCSAHLSEEAQLTSCVFKKKTWWDYALTDYHNTYGQPLHADYKMTPALRSFIDFEKAKHDTLFPPPNGNRTPTPLPAAPEIEILEPMSHHDRRECQINGYYQGIARQHISGKEQFVEMELRGRPVVQDGKTECEMNGRFLLHFGKDPQKTVALPYRFVEQRIDPAAPVNVIMSNRRDRLILEIERRADGTLDVNLYSNYLNFFGSARLAGKINKKPIPHPVHYLAGVFREDLPRLDVNKRHFNLHYRWRALTLDNFYKVETVRNPFERFFIQGNLFRVFNTTNGTMYMPERTAQDVAYDFSRGSINVKMGNLLVNGQVTDNGLVFQTVLQEGSITSHFIDLGRLRSMNFVAAEPPPRPFDMVGVLDGDLNIIDD